MKEAFDELRPLFPSRWSVYVECIDGNYSSDGVLWVLKDLEIVGHEATQPVLSSEIASSLNFNDDRIFPNYDAIWVVAGDGAGLEHPPFNTYWAAENEGSFPRTRTGARFLESWAPVEEWMRQNHAVIGIATAATVMTICRHDGPNANGGS